MGIYFRNALQSSFLYFFSLVHSYRRYTNQYLDIHPSRNALVLHYTVEVVAFNEYGEPIIADSKECVKM